MLSFCVCRLSFLIPNLKGVSLPPCPHEDLSLAALVAVHFGTVVSEALFRL